MDFNIKKESIDEKSLEKELKLIFSDFPGGIKFYKESLLKKSPYYPSRIFYPDRGVSGPFILYILNPTTLSKFIGTEMQAAFIKRVLLLYLDFYNFSSVNKIPQRFLPSELLYRLDFFLLILKDTYWHITRSFIAKKFKLKEPFPKEVEDVSCYIIAFHYAGWKICACELVNYLKEIIKNKIYRKHSCIKFRPSLQN